MLHCAGDTTGDIQLRPHRLTGLADLVFIGDQPGVHDLTGHAHSAAQYLGQLLDHCNALLRRHTGAGCDHDIRIIHGGRIFLLQIIQDFGQHGSLAAAMVIGLLVAVFVTYRKPREYNSVETDTSNTDAITESLDRRHYVAFASIIVILVIQVITADLALAALGGIIIMILFGAIKWNEIDKQVNEGIKLMGMICLVFLIAGGYASVIRATGGVESLVGAASQIMRGNKLIASIVIVLIGLVVCMGIGTSFGTVPILATIYVPLCQNIGFSVHATILLIAAAAAMGDAASPASDVTLAPTAGLNVDGQHDHIWDSCVPGFLHFSLPIMLTAVIVSQFI